MAEFVLELYVPRTRPEAVAHGADRTRLAADELTQEGTPVRYLRSLFIPEDETCFHVCQAASADDVTRAAQRAALSYERVVEAIGSTADPKEK